MNQNLIEKLVAAIPTVAENCDGETLNNLLNLIKELQEAKPVTIQQETPGWYIYARVLTTLDGTKNYHPLVGGMYPSNNVEDYKMEAYTSIIDLQDSPAANLANMAQRAGYNMQILYVPDDVYKALEEKLKELVESVFNAVDEGVKHLEEAAAIMGNPMAEGALKAMALEKLMSRPMVSGVGLTASNEIVEKGEYVDEEVERDDYYDEDWEDEEDDDYWDEEEYEDEEDDYWDEEDEEEVEIKKSDDNNYLKDGRYDY